ncbi:MAG: hypothetical protein H7144_10225 [Burkholderiales bacterium]|nr:hypothetical protein [Phycisphaerae bacterium]
MVYSGDGLTVRVAEWDEEAGTLRGEIVRGDQTFPFTGRHREADGAETITGTFKAGGDSFEFTSRQDAQSGEAVMFTTGGKTYRLMPSGTPATDAPTKPAPKNPFGDDATPASAPPAPVSPVPVSPARTAPAPQPPDNADVKPADIKPGDAKAPNANQPTLRLKQHAFPDVTMGAPEAYTILLPTDWSAKGEIEWQPVGEVPFPQLKIELNSPQKGRVRFVPQITLSYSEAPGMGRQGIAPPQNFPQWLIEAVAQTNKKVSNVKLVNSRRDTKIEASYDEIARATGQRPGMHREVHVITMEYDEADVRRREEGTVTYIRFEPFNGINGFHTQTWSIFDNGAISAPADQFEAQKPMLMNIAATLRPTPQWHTHSQAVIAEMSRKRIADSWTTIRDRGRQISQMSDADHAKYKKDMSGNDEQRKRINGIYETDDFRDTDGKMVNLPMHYHHVFSDGKGNYVLSNNSLDKPGATWNEIEPMK